VKICQIEGCEKRVAGRGWCQMHYKRWSKFGDPMPDVAPQRTKQEGQGPCKAENCSRDRSVKGYCSKHYQRLLKHGDAEHVSQIRDDNVARFWAYADTSGGDDACWPWHSTDRNGYGSMFLNGEGRRSVLAHRFAYELLVGPIPEGLVIDHTCHRPSECDLASSCPHRRCCNPRHLEAVETVVNNHRGNTWSGRNVRKTHCPQGHPYDDENTFERNGVRTCRTCARARTLAHYHRTKKLKS